MVDFDKIQARVKERGQIVDMYTISGLVFRGDITFVERVLLTALLKSERQVKERILSQISSEHFGMYWFALLFDWIAEQLQLESRVDEATLYRKMETYVSEHWKSASDSTLDRSQDSTVDMLVGYLAVIDHIIAIETPDEETVDKAILWIREHYVRRKERGLGR